MFFGPLALWSVFFPLYAQITADDAPFSVLFALLHISIVILFIVDFVEAYEVKQKNIVSYQNIVFTVIFMYNLPHLFIFLWDEDKLDFAPRYLVTFIIIFIISVTFGLFYLLYVATFNLDINEQYDDTCDNSTNDNTTNEDDVSVELSTESDSQ